MYKLGVTSLVLLVACSSGGNDIASAVIESQKTEDLFGDLFGNDAGWWNSGGTGGTAAGSGGSGASGGTGVVGGTGVSGTGGGAGGGGASADAGTPPDDPPPPPPPPPGDCLPSALGDTCTGMQICIADGQCADAFGTTYTVTVEGASLASTTPSGGDWDPFGGSPDPYVSILLNSSPLGKTASASDTYDVAWTTANVFEASLNSDDTITIELWEEDGINDDLGFTCDLPVDAILLRSRVLECASGGSTASATIAPLP